MPDRPRHPKPELEQLIKDAEAYGWRVSKGKKYFKALCSCLEKHSETIHLSPSDPNYPKNKRNKMRKCPTWPEK